jgi:hypothetical protein
MGKVLHASGSGYFPFCPADSIDDSPFKITTSLANMMGLYWRVKQWKITASGSFTILYESENFIPFIFSYNGTGNWKFGFPIQSEEHLACIQYLENYSDDKINGTLTIIFPNGEPGIYYGDLALVSFFPLSELAKNENSTYSTILSVLTSSNGLGVIGLGTVASNQSIFGVLTVGTIEYKFLNEVISTVPCTTPRSGLLDALSSTNFKLVIEPAEYWSYGGTYDTTTGLPL